VQHDQLRDKPGTVRCLVHYSKILTMRIFGSEASPALANLALVCDRLLRLSEQPNDRAFAWNLVHDGRLNEEWAEYWNWSYGRPASPDALMTSLNRYHNDLRERPLDTYADISSRARNFVRPRSPDGPADGELLVHVLDLWSPGARVIWEHGRRQEIGMLSEIGDLRLTNPAPPPAISSAFETGTVAGQRPIMTDFFDAFEDYFEKLDEARREGETMATLNPFWVSLWEPWMTRAGDTAEDWCESVGLSKAPERTPVWVAVLQYSVRRAHRLIRPTQLEAHWYGRHFPTPPACRAPQGGRIVEGRESVSSAEDFRPLREYIHAPIPLRLADWLAAGFPVQRSRLLIGDPLLLERDRSAHWDALCNEFPDVPVWMAEPNYANIPFAI
jgi:hypothetical protein